MLRCTISTKEQRGGGGFYPSGIFSIGHFFHRAFFPSAIFSFSLFVRAIFSADIFSWYQLVRLGIRSSKKSNTLLGAPFFISFLWDNSLTFYCLTSFNLIIEKLILVILSRWVVGAMIFVDIRYSHGKLLAWWNKRVRNDPGIRSTRIVILWDLLIWMM